MGGRKCLSRAVVQHAGTAWRVGAHDATALAREVAPLMQHIDRQAGDELHVTHEGIAGLPGVRREGVTEAALALQRAGVIRYRRGHLQLLDRRGLGQHSCECYGVVERAYGPLWGSGCGMSAATAVIGRGPLPARGVDPLLRQGVERGFGDVHALLQLVRRAPVAALVRHR